MRVFITGLCGTLGTAIALLHKERGDFVTGCSRNEERVANWINKHERIPVQIADAGSDWMLRLVQQFDRIYHCAAQKHVNLCENNPLEAWRQNVELTAKIMELVGNKTVFISSDKACAGGGGMSIYGATKLTAERIALQAGAAVVRLGNLIGSSGSVLPLWKEAKELQLTDPDMTRYFISVSQATRFAVDAVLFGQLRVPTGMKAVWMGDLAAAFNKPVKIVGLRPGETKHQWLIAAGETVNGKVWSEGLRSDEAPRWDALELLKEMP